MIDDCVQRDWRAAQKMTRCQASIEAAHQAGVGRRYGWFDLVQVAWAALVASNAPKRVPPGV